MQCLFVSTFLRVSIIDLNVSLSTHVTHAQPIIPTSVWEETCGFAWCKMFMWCRRCIPDNAVKNVWVVWSRDLWWVSTHILVLVHEYCVIEYSHWYVIPVGTESVIHEVIQDVTHESPLVLINTSGMLGCIGFGLTLVASIKQTLLCYKRPWSPTNQYTMVGMLRTTACALSLSSCHTRTTFFSIVFAPANSLRLQGHFFSM